MSPLGIKARDTVDAARRRHLLLPLLGGVLVLVFSLTTGHELRSRENLALRDASIDARQRVGSEVQGHLEEEIRGLAWIGHHWVQRGGLSKEEWTVDAKQLLDPFGEMQAIEWVDSSFHVRWIVPLEGNEAAVDLDLGFEQRRRLALEAARDGRRVTITCPIELVQGGRGFLVYVPLYVNEVFDGFVLGVYRIDELLGTVLRNVAPGYKVRIWDNDELVYLRATPEVDPSLTVSTTLEIFNISWVVELSPTHETVSTHRTWLPEFVALGGFAVALFLGVTIQLTHVARRRALHLLAARNQLSDEMARRERAEDAEVAAWEELKTVVASLPDHLWSGDITSDGRFVSRYLSHQIEEISGRPSSLFREGKAAWLNIVCPEDRDRIRDAYRAVLEGRSDEMTIEYRIERSDCEIRWIREHMLVTGSARMRRVDGVTSDITEWKEAEERRVQLEMKIQQTQKLESLGVLAGGIAHDFNNLLVGMLGHASIALQDLPSDSLVRRNVSSIEKAARRASALCRQMLAYAGKRSVLTEAIDLGEAIREMGELLSVSIPKSVEIRYDISNSLPAIEADASQIRQVVMNLITNAAEAIGERGVIEITGRLVECDEEVLASVQLGGVLEPGKYVEIVIVDDGCGMDEETRQRLFEPFYSTKFSGRGLGLAAVLGIVRSHNGAIKVESEPERGTRIRLLLPATPGAEMETPTSPEAPSNWRGSGTVLVVDDEEAAREVASLLLSRAGFRVLEASDGAEALEVLTENSEIACILLDLTMPNLDGTETYESFRNLGSRVPVILCSGYTEQKAVEHFDGQELAGFLEKPYKPESLLLLVRNAIEGRPEDLQ